MKITVLKKNLAGERIRQYEGKLIRFNPNAIVLEALFDHPDMPFVDVVLRQNDRFCRDVFY